MYGLVDCNNFYVSCERAFDPSLKGRPVIVLSNNDGNAVALSNEAKELGIPFGAPYFSLRGLIAKNGVAVLSSNYSLYGDMSRRVMDVLASSVPEIEIYSIDEAFLFLGGIPGVAAFARDLREQLLRWTGIPVSIGVARSKTLAKAASKIAKRNPCLKGVFMMDEAGAERALGSVMVEDVWGVGRQYKKLLNARGIRTALELREAPERWVKKNMTICGLRTVMELRGVPCIPLEEMPGPKKGIVSSRSFGRPVESLSELREAVASYVTRGAEKLRRQRGLARSMIVFITTNRFRTSDPQYSNGIAYEFPVPTSYTPHLIRYGTRMLERIYRPGFRYKKAGVMFPDIAPEGDGQLSLFHPPPDPEKARLMDIVDRLNREMGRDTLRFAAGGMSSSWAMRRLFLSPRYTTRWGELAVARA